jgi:hypothetical protein
MDEYLPVEQALHVSGVTAASVVEYLPVGQAGQPVAENRPMPVPYVPFKQSPHPFPRASWNFRAEHAVQVALEVSPKPVEYIPAAHGRQPDICPSPVADEYVLDPQLMQRKLPTAPLDSE